MAESARMRLSSRLLAGTRHYADSVSRSGQFAHTVRGGERWRRRERERRQQAEECLPLQQKGIGDGGGQQPKSQVDGVPDWTQMEVIPKSSSYHVPYFIVAVSIAELVAFLYEVVRLKSDSCIDVDAAGPPPLCSPLIYNPYRRYEAWRLLTYMAVHTGYIHVASNIAVQILLGLPLEIVHGPFRIGAVYVAGVLTGSLASSVFDPGSFLAGASAGGYAVMAAHLPTLIMNWREINSILEWAISALTFFIAAFDVALAVYNRYAVTGGGDSHNTVAYAAHAGGALAGFLVGMNVLRNFHKLRWEGIMRVICIVAWTALLCGGVFVNALAGDGLFPPADHGPIETSDCRYLASQCDYGLIAR